MPHPMRLPEEPPSEPTPYIMPNLYCPVDPDTPYNYEIEPREEDVPLECSEPIALRQPFEPDDPPYPERMIKSSTEDMMSDKLDEPDNIRRVVEPDHDDEPMLTYPRQEREMHMPIMPPSKFEPSSIIEPSES